jgi:hypothetical protein
MKKIPCYILIAICLFTSCEYDPSGNNFLELTPPDDYIISEISLNDMDPSDTIYVFQDTRISIKINASKELRQAVILFDGSEYKYLWSNPFNFVIRPGEISEGVHKLTVNAFFASGTGSLAEMMGMEGYVGELSWNIRVIPDPASSFEVGYRVNKEGFLEVYWDNTIPESSIEKYTVRLSYPSSKELTIADPMQKSFVDYGYVCGYAYYEVKTYLKSEYSYMKNLSFNTPAPAIHFEDMGPDQLRVYWDKPFAKGQFNLIDDNGIISSKMNDTTITIPQLFGRNRNYHLETWPLKAEYENFYNRNSAWGSFCQGIILGLPNWELYAYNRIDNILYTRKYDRLFAFNAVTLEELNSVLIMGDPWGFAYGGKIASAPHNSTVAAMTGEKTCIFTDSRFVNPIIIPDLPGDIHTRLAALTSDDRFFVVQKNSNNCQVFNSKTGIKLFDFQFKHTTIYDIPDFVIVSEDGRFFCASSENGMEVFEMNGTTTRLLYADTRHYKGAISIPSQPDKLLLRVNSEIEIRQLPDFNLIQKFDVAEKGASLCNIDPASMSLLYYQNDSLKVAKINNIAEPIFKLRSNENTCKMFNNKLLTYGKGGIVFDISPYLNP